MNVILILFALLTLPHFHADRHESPQERFALLAPVAIAIAHAAHNPTEAALLIAVGFHESTYSRAVLSGNCAELGPHACDSGAARSAFQLHRSACPAAWLLPAGSPESLRVEADCAIKLLRFGASRCREHALTPWHGALATYAGAGCTWRGADTRMATTRKVLASWGKS